VVTASRYRRYSRASVRIGFCLRRAPTITSGTIRPTLLIVGPPYSAVIVSADTIFEQRLAAAPTATVRTSPSRSCLRRNAAGAMPWARSWDAVSFRCAGARSVVPRWRSLAEILRPNGVLHTIHASQNVQCQNRKHQAQTGCRNDESAALSATTSTRVLTLIDDAAMASGHPDRRRCSHYRRAHHATCRRSP